MSFGNLVSMLGAAAGGINRGLEDVRRNKERDDEKKFRDEQRARMVAEQDRADKTRLGLAEAMAPTQAQAQEVAGPTMDGAPLNVYKAGGQGFPSMAEATTAATAYNSPEARLQRGSDVLAAQGDAAGAVRMVGDAQRSKLTGMQVKQAEQAQADHAQLREFAGALQQGGWSAVPKIYDRYQDGFGASVTEDGKGGASIQRIKDGKPVGAPINFASLPEFFTTVAGRFDPEKWMADTAAAKKEDAARADSDRNYDLRKRVVDAQVGHYQRMGTGGAGGVAQGQPAPAPTQWDKESDTFLRQRYTVTDPMSGTTSVDGMGLQFAKQIAIAQAQRNGGDTTSALGYAFEIDNRLRKMTGDDPAKLNQERNRLLKSMQPKDEAPATQEKPAAPDAQKPAPAAAPARKPAPVPKMADEVRGDKVLAAMQAEKSTKAKAQSAVVEQAAAKVRAAASSGDPQALALYSKQYADELNKLNALQGK